MDDLSERLRQIEANPSPDLWSEISTRPLEYDDPVTQSPARRIAIIAASLAIGLAAVAWVVIAITPATSPPTPADEPILFPAPRTDCPTGLIRADSIDTQEFVRQMHGYLPTWLPEGFGLLATFGWDGAMDGSAGHGIWSDQRCREVELDFNPNWRSSGRVSPGDVRPSVGPWIIEADTDRVCGEASSRTSGCLIYSASTTDGLLTLAMMGLDREEGDRIALSIFAGAPQLDDAATPSLVPPTGDEHLVGDIDTFNGVWEVRGSDDGETRCQRIRQVGLDEPRLCVDAQTPLPDVHLTEIRSREMAFGAAPPGTISVEVLPDGAPEPFLGAVLPSPSSMQVNYPLYAVPLGGAGPGVIRFFDEAGNALAESPLAWKDRGQQAHPKIEGVFPADRIFAQDDDPIAGPWWIYGIEHPYGKALRVRGPHDVGGYIVKPAGDHVFGQTTITGFGNDVLLVLQTISPTVDRVELQMDDGSAITGHVYQVPSSFIDATNIFVAGFRGQITAEGSEISPGGEIVAFDENGVEIGRKPLAGAVDLY